MARIYFTDEHEWISVDGDTATVGITNHAQEQLGDLVYVELPEPGRTVSKGDDCVVVESVKAASDVYAPVAGEIVEVNPALSGEPGLVNASAEGDGWLFRMKLADPSELDGLMDRSAYEAMIA